MIPAAELSSWTVVSGFALWAQRAPRRGAPFPVAELDGCFRGLIATGSIGITGYFMTGLPENSKKTLVVVFEVSFCCPAVDALDQSASIP